MRFFHLADLHLGKVVNGFSMLEDQRHILGEVTGLVRRHRPEAVVLAGDIYDRAVPPAEAVALYDGFLTQLAGLGAAVLAVAGNHDSAERLGFGGRLLTKGGVYCFGPCLGQAERVTLGGVHFDLLPFVRPLALRAYFEGERMEGCHDAVRLALAATPPPEAPGPRVLVAHQFVVAGGARPEESDSELRSAGGLEAVDASLFEAYSYVALGHLHRPQRMGRDTIRYAGSPLKYSVSEWRHQKAVQMVDIAPDGSVEQTALPLVPLRDLRVIEGPFEALMDPAVVGAANHEDYVSAVLHDELEIPEAMAKLRRAYPNAMELHYENRRSEAPGALPATPEWLEESPADLFCRFYEEQNGAPPSARQLELLRQAGIEEVAP